MTADDVVALYARLTQAGVRVWVDGGWGVDALLGRQTRPHADLDVAVEFKHVPAVRTILVSEGFTDVATEDATRWNFVVAEFMVAFHTGYPLRATDVRDVTALCEAFGLAYPDGFEPFRK
jgi:lincosamide nucleotidyltransferase A/C/D/E